ncbi:ABC transporter permease [Pseudochrobactrum asaccharolyticum]|uniref:Putative spermidine/putrescine transport system permease protein n=1 Tax=Pseudochrobactrum asaccharolyticum TaxID=354351 RepID=A0A366DZZ0_9HYPH|nr:ABC transporter permease [Pseudochrobactrum asaccharolyticum]RBO95680.1 putative spermidine/putrescine transport system permease protein [Pseudochrobactrum asaccharolyticum]
MISSSKNIRAMLLIAPLFVFILLFFIWPLGVMMKQAVSDTAVLQVLPRTVEAVKTYNGNDAPTPEMKQALVDDLKASTDQLAMGDMIRRLNSAQPGFRTLMTKTVSALEKTPAPDLEVIDKRWSQPQYWRAVAGALSPWTDRNLLAAVDMERDASGNLASKDTGTSANRAIMLRTFWIAALVTLACALIGYPYAILLAGAAGWVRNLLFAAVLLPLWTSLLVRTAAWFILLQDKGLINDMFIWLGLTDSPLPLIFNRAGVIIAMTHVLLPFMVLPIYSVLIAVPNSLMPAAASLGAAPWRAFLRVLLPLSMRGVLSGMLLVFMSAIGYYITPALIGGPGDQMISSIIAYYATGSANWGMAGALGMVLLVACLLLYAVYGRLTAEEKGKA